MSYITLSSSICFILFHCDGRTLVIPFFILVTVVLFPFICLSSMSLEIVLSGGASFHAAEFDESCGNRRIFFEIAAPLPPPTLSTTRDIFTFDVGRMIFEPMTLVFELSTVSMSSTHLSQMLKSQGKHVCRFEPVFSTSTGSGPPPGIMASSSSFFSLSLMSTFIFFFHLLRLMASLFAGTL